MNNGSQLQREATNATKGAEMRTEQISITEQNSDCPYINAEGITPASSCRTILPNDLRSDNALCYQPSNTNTTTPFHYSANQSTTVRYHTINLLHTATCVLVPFTSARVPAMYLSGWYPKAVIQKDRQQKDSQEKDKLQPHRDRRIQSGPLRQKLNFTKLKHTQC